ncbi:unnamed protein product [Camellia sinensis]
MLSPPHPPPWRKAPKAVDEDLYRISPELLLAKHRRLSWILLDVLNLSISLKIKKS